MARKATDLLDVFRYGGDDDGGDGDGSNRPDRGSKGKPRKKAAKHAEPRQRFEGISLNRRQLVLTSSSIGLLLILSFVLGLAAGRPGGGDSGSALNRRSSEKVAIRARLPVVDPATRKAVSASSVARDLARDYRIRPQNLRIRRHGSELIIDIGPFSSREEARGWLRRSGLEMAHIHMEDPFRFAEFPAVRWER